MHNTIEESADELEETLSLCDLPLYSDQSADWDHDFSLASNSISSSSQEDYFEFFSQELSSTTTTTAPENIIFCGKLIPYQQPPRDQLNSLEIKIQTIDKGRHYWQLFRWKLPKRQVVLSENGTTKTNKLEKAGKWYFFVFGISIFSPVVELRDIKSRQRSLRRRVVNNDRGLWGLIIRVLSCGGNHHSTTVSVDGHASPE